MTKYSKPKLYIDLKILVKFSMPEHKQKGSSKTVWTFAAASFLNDMGSDIIYPVWPMFLTSYLGANLVIMGLIDGLGEALVSISQFFSGYYSDKYKKRKIFVWTGYLLGGVARLGYAISAGWYAVIPFKLLDRAGKMRGAPRDAIIADITPSDSRGKAYGLLRTMDNAGAVCGILLCLLLFPVLGYTKLFLAAAIPSFIGAALILYFVKEHPAEGITIFKGVSFRGFNRNLKLLIASNALFAFATFSYSFLLMIGKRNGQSTTALILLYLLFSVVAAVSSMPFGKLADRIGKRPVMLLSGVFWLLLCTLAFWAQHAAAMYIIFGLFGLFRGAIEPVQKAYIAEFTTPADRASIIGAFQMIIGLSALPASVIAGILWESLGLQTLLTASAVLMLSGMLLLSLVTLEKSKL